MSESYSIPAWDFIQSPAVDNPTWAHNLASVVSGRMMLHKKVIIDFDGISDFPRPIMGLFWETLLKTHRPTSLANRLSPAPGQFDNLFWDVFREKIGERGLTGLQDAA